LPAILAQVGVARLRLDRAAAAFPEIQQLGYFANLAEELEAEKRRRTGRAPTRFVTWSPTRSTASSRHVCANAFQRSWAIPRDRAIETGQPLTELGMDSLMAVRIRNTVRGDFGVEPPVALLLQGASLRDVTTDLIGQLGLTGPTTSSPRTKFAIEPINVPQRATSGHAAEGRTTSVSSNIELPLAQTHCRPTRLPSSAWLADSLVPIRCQRSGTICVAERNRSSTCRKTTSSPPVSEKRRWRSHSYVRRAALMDGIDEFDADFFGFTPQAARMMDPQHRLFLQCAWHALEDAGYDPAQIDGSVGVYGTSSASGYLLHNLMSHHDPHMIIGQGATFDMVNLSLQNDKDHLATRVAHQFNLRGPALSVQTACSSSLVALHLACQSILNGGMRHGTGRRRLDTGAAPRRVLARTRIDGLGHGSLPAVRRAVGWHHLRQRSRCRGSQNVAGRG
jgi:acyl carrier protein